MAACNRGLGGDLIFGRQTSREHHHPADWPGPDFKVILKSDGYENHRQLRRRSSRRVRRTACVAHLRGKFEASNDERLEAGRSILKAVGRLYQIETMLREHGAPGKARVRVRQDTATCGDLPEGP